MTSFITDPSHSLRLGDLDLISLEPHEGGFFIETMASETTWGNAAPVLQTIQGLLQDGAIVALDTWENREARLLVRVRVPAGPGAGQRLAAGEAALMAELGRRNTLVWTPPQEDAPPTVFDVEWSHLEHHLEDTDELLRWRTYAVVLICQPFARSVEMELSPVLSSPEPPVPETVVIDDGSSTSGWQARLANGTITTAMTTGDFVYRRFAARGGPYLLERTTPIDMDGMPLLRFEVEGVISGASYDWNALVPVINGIQVRPSARVLAGPNRIVWFIPITGPVNMIALRDSIISRSSFDYTYPGWYGELRVHSISRTDSLAEAVGSAHQISGEIPVKGSARTQASLQMWHDSEGLGDVLVHTSPRPGGMFSMEPYLTSVSTPASGHASGTSKTLAGFAPVTYQIPASILDHASTGYVMLARLRREGTPTGGPLVANVSAQMGDTALPPFEAREINPPALSDLTILNMGGFTLPPANIGPDGLVNVSVVLMGSHSGPSPVLDDVWLVDVDTGSLTWVACGSGTPEPGGASNRLWVDAPTVERPLPEVYVGTREDRSDARAAEGISSWMPHEYPPPSVYIYAVATGVSSSSIRIAHPKRWQTHAAE